MRPLTVEVVEGTELGPVFYEVNHERDGRAWMVRQRFSTLHAMVDTLKADKAELPDVPFPPKQWPLMLLWQAPCTPALSSDEMEERRSGLQTYLSALSRLKESWNSDSVTEVLCHSADDVSADMSPAFETHPRVLAPPATKTVSWVDQQPRPAAVTEAASALLSLSTSPPTQPRVKSTVSSDAVAGPFAPSIKRNDKANGQQAAAAGATKATSAEAGQKPSALQAGVPPRKDADAPPVLATTTAAAAATTLSAAKSNAKETETNASSSFSMNTADETLTGDVPGEKLLSAVMADIDRVHGLQAKAAIGASAAEPALVLPAAAQDGGHGDFTRELKEASVLSALALSSSTEESGKDEQEAGRALEGGDVVPTPRANKRRPSLLGRAKRSLSSKKKSDKDKGGVPDSLGVDAVGLSFNAPTTPGGAVTPRTQGRLSYFRDKARRVKGRLSGGGGGGGGPISLTSAKGKGKGFFSMSTTSPDGNAAPSTMLPEEIDDQHEPHMAATVSPASPASTCPDGGAETLKMGKDVLMAVGDESSAVGAPPSPGGE